MQELLKDKEKGIEKQRKFIIQFVYWGIIAGSIFFFGKYLLPILFPFLIAFLIAGILNQPVNFLASKTRISRKIIAVLSVILFLLLAGGVLSWIFAAVVNGIENIFTFLPNLFDDFIIPLVEQTFDKLEMFFRKADISFLEILESNMSVILESINQAVGQFSNSILSSLTSMITSIPTVFMQTVITIIATFFVMIDFEKIISFCKWQIPQSKRGIVKEVKNYFIKTLPKFILSYGCILFLTFLELFIGFVLLRIPNARILAVIIAILDILPILGTGTVLIPWSIINIILGNYSMAGGIFLLYVAITVIRNIVEPKMIGKQMGLPPIVTLASMLVGLKLFGIVGLLGFPILLSFLVKLNEDGTIKIFK